MDQNTVRFAGGAMAGVAEVGLFHPIDTCVKRLMNSQLAFSTGTCNTILFQEAAQGSMMQRFGSLFPGLGYAGIYKVSQRGYKWGGQPIVKEAMVKALEPQTKAGKTGCDVVAGMLMGIGEVVLLPFDVLKIKSQTNPEYRGVPMLTVMRQEGLSNLYAGWQWTMLRNAPGSAALFGGNALFKNYIFQLDRNSDATIFQHFMGSIGGAISSILVACPCDVIKTRIQSGTYVTRDLAGEAKPMGGMQIVSNIMKEEGMGAFFKGVGPKTLAAGPKLIFSFTIAQSLIGYLEKSMVK